MRFVTLFLKAQNVHLVKDIGMIPWLLRKEHGVDSELVAWQNGDYPYLETEVKGMKLSFIKKSPFGRIYDGCHYLKYEAPAIDVLNIYHLNLASYFYEKVYLKYNPMGRVYLKLDMNNTGFADCLKQNPKAWIKRSTIKRAEYVSVANKKRQEELSKRFPDKIFYLPNGFYDPSQPFSSDTAKAASAETTPSSEVAKSGGSSPAAEKTEKPETTPSSETAKAAASSEVAKSGDHRNLNSEKRNIILTVGNLGTWEKATDLLLSAFAKSAEEHRYYLHLIGPVEPGFEAKKTEFYENYPKLKDRVIFMGPITDREELALQYKRAKFFVLPSRSESFGFVLLEAGLEGCYLIVSDGCSAAADITDNGKYGKIVKADSENSLAEAFATLCQPDSIPDFKEEEFSEYIRTNYNWKKIIQQLYEKLMTAEDTEEESPDSKRKHHSSDPIFHFRKNQS